MRIDRINNYNNTSNFRSTNRIFFDKRVQKAVCLGEVSNYTCIFRKDIPDWFELAKYIVDNFKEKNKINVYSLACSDGSEAYSLAIALKKYIGNKQLFPIIAVDRDADIIEHAKKDRINLSGEDIAKMNEILGGNQKYFTDIQERIFIQDKQNQAINDWDSAIPKYYSFKKDDELQKLVDFRVENLIKTVGKIRDYGNTFVACRNVMPYLLKSDQKYLMKCLEHNLKKGSLVAIGNYDEMVYAADKLILHGFETTEIDNVFKRV